MTASTGSCSSRSPGRRSRPPSTQPGRPAYPSSSSTTSSPRRSTSVNVWSQNNSPAAAGVAGLVKTGNILMVRGIAGNPVEQAFQDAAVADIKACPGLKIVGTIWGKWTNATAKSETVKWLASHPRRQGRRRDPERDHDGRDHPGLPAGRPAGAADQRRRLPGRRALVVAQEQGDLQVGRDCFNGFQTGWSEFRLLAADPRRSWPEGRGTSTSRCPWSRTRTSQVYATPGKPLSWPGEPRGPIDGWASNKVLDGYFTKPGTPGGL